jgi:hypothetical protein
MTKKTNRASKKKPAKAGADDIVGKRIAFDRATWNAIDLMAREQMKDIPELAEEAFRDLLKKYGRTADFREALKLSVRRAKK